MMQKASCVQDLETGAVIAKKMQWGGKKQSWRCQKKLRSAKWPMDTHRCWWLLWAANSSQPRKTNLTHRFTKQSGGRKRWGEHCNKWLEWWQQWRWQHQLLRGYFFYGERRGWAPSLWLRLRRQESELCSAPLNLYYLSIIIIISVLVHRIITLILLIYYYNSSIKSLSSCNR